MLGLDTYGHVALFCLDSGNVITDINDPLRIPVISVTSTPYISFYISEA